ncbi:MAG: hypothetical protein E7099_07630 [Mediterranea massiliensis]|nr:hypothetical protein [Mediterranea massiliensis]
MKKQFFIILALFLSVNVADTSAQSFLNKVKKNIKKEVENRVNKEVKKQIDRNFDKGTETVSEKDKQPTESKPQDSKKLSRKESQDRHIQILVEKKIAVRTVIPTEKPQNTAPTTGKTNGHEWVDLGLPSGTRWATCNVGGTKPEQPGGLYAWGELATKTNYVRENSKTHGKDLNDISGKATHDVAAAKWGKGWRIPTKAEFDELLLHCNYKYVQRGDLWGHEFTNPTNKRSIFLPATGFKEGSSKHELAKVNGAYWTSSPHQDQFNNGTHIYIFGSALGEMSIFERSSGAGVRPVIDNDAMITVPASGETNGHQWVDLGLPSGLKWATCNLGAATSEHFGDTFTWGETKPTQDEKVADSKLYGKNTNDFSGNSQYDAATALWGKEWRMPTSDEFKELMHNCVWEWTSLGRINGCKVISKTNGNYIFLPIKFYSSHESYWTSTPGVNNTSTNIISLLETHISETNTNRRGALPIRPVTK